MKTAALLAFVSAIFGGVAALWTAFQERRSLPKWCFVAGMGLLAIESVFSGFAANAEVVEEAVYWHQNQLAVMGVLPIIWLLFSLTYGRGNSRDFLFKWKYTLMAAAVIPLTITVLFYRHIIVTGGMPIDTDSRLFRLTIVGVALYLLFLISNILVLMNLERTLQASVGTMRWRIKFMILGLGVLFAVRFYTSSQVLLFLGHGMDESLLTVDSVGLLVGSLLIFRSLSRGAEDVAVYPQSGVLKNSLILLLAGIYLLVVGVFAKLVEWVGGGASFQVKAFLILIALVGLTLVGLSDRVRLHVRRFFSRYLQRPLYDYRMVWRSFTEAIATRVKQEELCEAAVKQVAEIFQALSVTMWIMDEKRESLMFAASTSLSPAAAKELALTKEESVAVIQMMQERAEPLDIESSKDEWAVALRRWHPTQFRTGGGRICVPMAAGQQLLGVLTVGDRVGGIFFSLQDFDLLKCVGDQVAAGLLTAQLSQKLLQTKEMEAFQTMSAFFVHDLKNTASTLNLMLQNLPIHFDNPEFRADALRGVAKTCEHINHLIGRLSLLRHDLQIRPVESDLNDVIARVLSSWDGASGISLVKNFRPCPKIQLDQEQILKVVTNLVLNASEAVPRGGEIKVETSQSSGWAVLSVSDNGCGMTPEFMRRALFRPFQTTKKNGFGIGMFQSKMIVEAHGGRMEVESELKKGTTFRGTLASAETIQMMNPKLLIVDDDEEIRTQMKWALAKDYDISLAEDRASAIETFQAVRPLVVLLDLGLPPHPGDPEEGLATLSELLALERLAKVIIITGQGEKGIALRAIGAGAYDFLIKPVVTDELKLLLKRSFHVASLEAEFRQMQQLMAGNAFEGMMGTSAAVRSVFESIRKVATTDAPVLLLGESGTGKEMAARAIHQSSGRKNGPFIAINCSAIPETLLESELFGHEKGSFTGAHAQRKGRFEMANGGTLFLDEIGEIPLPLQVKLLRFLQEQCIERVGGRQPIQIDARVVTATNADLKKGMNSGTFREDLFYRLAVVQITLPPLRDRDGDVRLLAQFFLQRFGAQANKAGLSFDQEALRALDRYPWPGNVRQLENCIRRAVIMAEGKRLNIRDLELAPMSQGTNAGLKEARENLEREMIQNALRKNSGKIAPAAADLGISRPTLYDLMDKLGIAKEQ